MLQKITKTWVNREHKAIPARERKRIIEVIEECSGPGAFHRNGTHFSHLVARKRGIIIADVVAPLFGGDPHKDYHKSDQSYRFVKRDMDGDVVAFEDWFEIDQAGDSYVDAVWYRHGHGLYRTCLGDLLGWMEGRGFTIGDNDDLLLR